MAASTKNGVEVSASLTRMGGPAGASDADWATIGAGRTSSARGIKSTHAAMPMVSCALRQSLFCSSNATSGDTVIGATPMPAETSETAMLRLFGSHALTTVIIGTKKLPPERPTSTP